MRRRDFLGDLRRFSAIRVIVLTLMVALFIAFSWLSISAVRKLLALDIDAIVNRPGVSADVRAQLEQSAFMLRALQASSGELLVAVALACVALFAFVVVITNRLFFADKVSILGFRFEISEALREAEERREVAELTALGLSENIHELQELDHQMNALVRSASAARFFDFLDAVAQTAAFTIRPTSRAVRVSIWLYRKSLDRMRIIASYRVSLQTRETFDMPRNGPGFAATVLRENRMIVKNENFAESSGDWKEDRTETHGTESILGVPVAVDEDEWDAVLCFSTDRSEDAFAKAGDRAAAAYFATVASTLLHLALSAEPEGRTSMVDEFWNRYRRSDE